MRRVVQVILIGIVAAALVSPAVTAQPRTKLVFLTHPTLFGAMGGRGGLIDAYASKSGVEVEVVTAPTEQIKEKAVVEFVARSGRYDAIHLSTTIMTLDMFNYVERLDPFLARSPIEDAADIVQATVEPYRFPRKTGTTYGIPFRFGTTMLYYRKDLLQKHNVRVPATLADLVTAAKALTLDTDNDGKIDVYGHVGRSFPGSVVVIDFLRFLYASGGDVLDERMQRCTLTEADAVRALEVYTALYRGGSSPQEQLSWSRDEQILTMQQGRAALAVMFSPYYGRIVDPKQSKVADQIGWALMPTASGIPRGQSFNDGWAFVIDKNSRNKDQAWEFIKWMSSRENQLTMAMQYANGPVRASTYRNPEFLKRFPVSEMWLQGLAASRTIPPHHRYPQIEDIVSEEVVASMRGTKSPRDALGSACTRIQAILR